MTVYVDSSNLPLESYNDIRALLNEEQFKEFAQKVQNALEKGQEIVMNLSDYEDVLPNTTIQNLSERFPNARFPEDTDNFKISDKEVLFVEKYTTTDGKILFGRFNQNGKEIFIVDESHLNNLAEYFLVLKGIKSDGILNNLDPSIKFGLDKIRNLLEKHKRKYNSYNGLLLDYINSKDSFKRLNFLNESGELIDVSVFLDSVIELITNVTKRRNYRNSFVNNLSKGYLKWKNSSQAGIVVGDLFSILPEDLKESIEKCIGEKLTITKFKEFFNTSIKDNLINLQAIFNIDIKENDEKSWKILFDYIKSLDPDFKMNYKDLEGNKIILEKFYPNLENFGIDMFQLQELEKPVYYNGNYILKKQNGELTEYYVTSTYPNIKQFTARFLSLDEAKAYIDSPKKKVKDNSYELFHFREQDDQGNYVNDDNACLVINTPFRDYKKGTLLTLLDFNIPRLDIGDLGSSEQKLLGKKDFTMQDFYDYLENFAFDTSVVKSKINTPEKVMLFIYGINNPKVPSKNGPKPFNKNSQKAFEKLADQINSAPLKYYYISETTPYKTKLIPVKNGVEDNYRKQQNFPIVSLWDAASKVIGKRLGIEMEVLPQSQIEELFGNSIEENAKAFIKNNKVYINLDRARSSDLFHEYSHIVLAYLKNNSNLRKKYVDLISTVWNLGKDSIKDGIMNSYQYNSIEDKMEEYFVIKFGEWINDNADSQFSNIFSKNETLKDTINLFSDTPMNVKELYGKKINELFGRFNHDIAIFFEENKTLMDGEFADTFKMSRQRSKWIRDQIKDKKLIEYDCV